MLACRRGEVGLTGEVLAGASSMERTGPGPRGGQLPVEYLWEGSRPARKCRGKVLGWALREGPEESVGRDRALADLGEEWPLACVAP